MHFIIMITVNMIPVLQNTALYQQYDVSVTMYIWCDILLKSQLHKVNCPGSGSFSEVIWRKVSIVARPYLQYFIQITKICPQLLNGFYIQRMMGCICLLRKLPNQLMKSCTPCPLQVLKLIHIRSYT